MGFFKGKKKILASAVYHYIVIIGSFDSIRAEFSYQSVYLFFILIVF